MNCFFPEHLRVDETSFWLLENLSKIYLCWPVLDLHNATWYVFNAHNMSNECLLIKWLISSLSYWYSLPFNVDWGISLDKGLTWAISSKMSITICFLQGCEKNQAHSRYQCVMTITVDWILVNVDLTVRQSEKLFLWIERAPVETASAKVSFQEIILNRLAFPFRMKKMASE